MVKKIAKKIQKAIKIIISKRELKKTLVHSDEKKIIYIGSPLHGNIGDHAISIAIVDILKSFQLPIIEIPGERYMLAKKLVLNYVHLSDIIVITGGGLIGNLWMNEEEMIKDVINNFNDNKIIIMPQTYYFDDNEEGNKELKSLKETIDKHKNIYLCSREEKSYKICKKNFKKVKGNYLLPDVVLTLKRHKKYIRDGILVILRADKEKHINGEKINELLDNKNVRMTTTVLNKGISLKKRDRIFNNKLEEFMKAELVITDRLHGMIFAAITSTPCIALDNKSKKVSGVYKWLEKLDYIFFCKSIEEVDSYLKKIDLNKTYKYNLNTKYKEMITKILKKII